MFASWCERVRVERALSFDGEQDRVLRVHLDVLVVLAVCLVARRCCQVWDDNQV